MDEPISERGERRIEMKPVPGTMSSWYVGPADHIRAAHRQSDLADHSHVGKLQQMLEERGKQCEALKMELDRSLQNGRDLAALLVERNQQCDALKQANSDMGKAGVLPPAGSISALKCAVRAIAGEEPRVTESPEWAEVTASINWHDHRGGYACVGRTDEQALRRLISVLVTMP